MDSSNPFKAPSVTLFMSGSSTYSLLMRCSTSVYTPSCGYGRSVDALLPSTLPSTSSSRTHVEVVTTRYLIRLFIGLNPRGIRHQYSRWDRPPGRSTPHKDTLSDQTAIRRFWLPAGFSGLAGGDTCGDGRACAAWPSA